MPVMATETLLEQQLAEAQSRIAELERELAQARQLLNFVPIVLDAMPGRVFWKDLDLNYLGSNRKFAEDAGLSSQEELIGKSDYDMGWKAQAEQYRADDREVIESGIARINIEESQTTPEGQTRWLETSKIPLRDASGKVIALLGTYSDITLRKRDQQAIIESEAKARELQNLFRIVLDTIPIRVFWKDSNLNYLGSNQKFAEDSGFTGPDQLVGKSDFEMGWKDQAELYRADDSAVIKSGVSKINFEEPQTTPDGQMMWLETSKIPLRDTSGKIIGVLGTYSDITPRKRDQQALVDSEAKARRLLVEREALIEELEDANRITRESSRAKSEFLATMSHELRTPLNAIIGFSDMMLIGINGPLNEKQKHKMERLKENGNRLLALINDLLDLTRIEAGRVELVQKPFAPRAMVDRLVAQMESLAAATKLEFKTVISPDVPAVILGDEKRVEQVILNLLSNAFKFTEHGSVTLEVTAALPQKTWSVSVTDTGIGIPPHAQNLIFEAFRQVDGSYSRAYRGSGLGLAITRDLVRMMEGKIAVKSTVGSGSTFTVTLPLNTPVADGAPVQPQSENEGANHD